MFGYNISLKQLQNYHQMSQISNQNQIQILLSPLNIISPSSKKASNFTLPHQKTLHLPYPAHTTTMAEESENNSPLLKPPIPSIPDAVEETVASTPATRHNQVPR